MGELRIDNLVKTFPSSDGESHLVAVDELNLDIADGEFLVLLGPSGCGKSTTLRCVAGLESPTGGRLLLDGDDITDRTPQGRDMAMVFQDFALYPHMTAEENMSFGLRMTTDLSKDEIASRVAEAAELLDITAILGKKPGQISGGQKQRVALGRAIVRDPEVFLMDEPLSNLDAKLRTQMRTEIQRIHRQLGVTTIYVTHDQTEAMTMGSRIAILDDGELQQVDIPDTVYHHPTNQFVAGFIGSPSMNFLDVGLDRTDGTYHLVADGETPFEYPVDDELVDRCGLSLGDALTLGVRPEAIRLADSAAGGRVLQAQLDVVEPMGSDNYLYLFVGDSSWTARVDSSVDPEAGESISYLFDPEALHLFDDRGRTLKSTGTGERSYHDGTAREGVVDASAVPTEEAES